MANYTTLEYSSSAPSSPAMEVEASLDVLSVSKLTVTVALYPESYDYQYKIWGVETTVGSGVVETEQDADWLPVISGTRTVKLARTDDPQYVYVKYRDSELSESSVLSAGPIYFGWVEPATHTSARWATDFEALDFDDATSNTLESLSGNLKIILNKNKINNLDFDGFDFTGVQFATDKITIAAGSDIYNILKSDSSNQTTISGSTSKTKPLLMVNTGEGFTTLTAYDNTEKSNLPLDYIGKFANFTFSDGVYSFDVNSFSTYGLAELNKIEFTPDSGEGGTVSGTIVLKVLLTDTNGEGVESAPVTFSGSGTIGSLAESMPVNTNADGYAYATINITNAGVDYYTATVDSLTTDPYKVYAIDPPENLQRSLLTQEEQIFKTATYRDDLEINSEVAYPNTISGLEYDMNVMRSILRQIKGTDNWFDEPGKYFDPLDAGADGQTANKTITLDNIKGSTLDANTLIVAVEATNKGDGFDISTNDEGFYFGTAAASGIVDLAYAKNTDLRGMPIYYSAQNPGTYYDEGGSDDVCIVDLIDSSTGTEFADTNGNIIYAKLHDGDNGVSGGEGENVYVAFYTVSGTYTWTASDPSNVFMILPYRKVMSEMNEWEWMRTNFVTSWEGDEALIDDISNVWSFTGAINSQDAPSWTDTGLGYSVESDDDLNEALDGINASIGGLDWSGLNYLSVESDIAAALDTLDSSIKDVSNTTSSGVADKYMEVVASGILADSVHMLPTIEGGQLSYTQSVDGKNMDVYMNGQLLTASTGAPGAGGNQDMDYTEYSNNSIMFHMFVPQYSNITYMIRS